MEQKYIQLIIYGSLAIVLTTLFIVIRCKKGGLAGLFTKTLASFAFMLLGIFGIAFSNSEIVVSFIIAGLLCGLIGDILLDLKVIYKENNDSYLNAGMLSFFVGHIFYILGLLFYTSKINFVLPLVISLVAGLIFSCLVLVLSKPLKLNFGKFKWQSLAYSFILSFTCVLSIYLAILLKMPFLSMFAVGLTLILISDLVLSKQYFGGQESNKVLITLNHAIYYAGQILIACFIYFI